MYLLLPAVPAALLQSLASQALTSLIQSNHANQDKATEEGGIEIIAELLEGLVVPQQVPQQPPPPPSAPLYQLDDSGDGSEGGGPHASEYGGLVVGTSSSQRVDVLESLLRLLGAMVEFNDANQQAARWELFLRTGERWFRYL